MLNRFNAEILSQWYASAYKNTPLPPKFIFSKNKIHFPEATKLLIEKLDFDPYQGTTLTDKLNYTLERVYHEETDKAIYQITFSDTKKYIKVNWWNRFLLMVVHKRLWVQKEPLAVFSFILAVIAIVVSILKK